MVVGDYINNDTDTEGWEQVFDVEDIFLHPLYDTTTTDYDLTLMKLKGNITFNERVLPACFPPDQSRETFDEGLLCQVSGWGTIDPEGNKYGNVLKYDEMPLISYDKCR